MNVTESLDSLQSLITQAEQNPSNALIQYEAACLHDRLGLESAAIPFYVRAIEMGLPETHRRAAYLGLGSTYRVLGQFEKSLAVFEQASTDFPAAREFIVFKAMTLHNLGHSQRAIEDLLLVIAQTSNDPDIQQYQRAITHYAADISAHGD